jgi:hypothetical protein
LQISLKIHLALKVIIRQLSEGEDQRPLLKEMKRMTERNIVLDCKVERIASVLEQAQQVGLMSLAHSYLITSLDIHLVNFDKVKYTGANITGVQLVDMTNTETANIVANWVYGEMRYGKNLDLTEKTLRVIIRQITFNSASYHNDSIWNRWKQR